MHDIELYRTLRVTARWTIASVDLVIRGARIRAHEIRGETDSSN